MILWKMSGNYSESDLILRNSGSAVRHSVTVEIRKSTVWLSGTSGSPHTNGLITATTRLGQQDWRYAMCIPEPRSHNHWCRGRTINITYSECVCVCSSFSCFARNAHEKYYIVIRLYHIFTHDLKKRYDLRENAILNIKYVSFPPQICLKLFSF